MPNWNGFFDDDEDDIDINGGVVKLPFRGIPSPPQPLPYVPSDDFRPTVLYAADGGQPGTTASPVRPPNLNAPGNLNRFEGQPGYDRVFTLPGDVAKPPLTIQNDDANAPSSDRSIDERLARLLEGASEDVTDFNINSTLGGDHATNSAHYGGRAADINSVGGLGAADPDAKPAVDKLVDYFKADPDVDRIFGPYYNGVRDMRGNWQAQDPRFQPHQQIIDEHKTHVHVGVRAPY